MKPEELEFAISQYLDGTLPPGQLAELKKVLGSDPQAQELLGQYQALDAILKSADRLPAIDWGGLQTRISSVVARQPMQPEAEPIDEQAELAIVRYLDGDLEGAARHAVERRLADDAAARHIADQHLALLRLLSSAWRVPAVNWDRLHRWLSEAVEAVDVRAGRFWARVRRVALAASVLVVVGLIVWLLRPGGAAVSRHAAILGPVPQTPLGQPVAQIEIAPADPVADARYSFLAAGIVEQSQPQLRLTMVQPRPGQPVADPLFQ